MHAHQLILKTLVDRLHSNRLTLHLASETASGAAFRLELTDEQNKLNRIESELLQIAARRAWELKPALRLFPQKPYRHPSDSFLAEMIIRRYTDTLIQARKLLHSLPYPDPLTETAVEMLQDCLIGCVFRLLKYL